MAELLEEQQAQIALQKDQDRSMAYEIAGDDSTGTKGNSDTTTTHGHSHHHTHAHHVKTPEEIQHQEQVDARSVYVRNVSFTATPDEVESLFCECGVVNRVTILFDRVTGRPKGYAYVEFSDADGATRALSMDGHEFKGRAIGVMRKRTNLPGFRTGGRGGRGGVGRRARGRDHHGLHLPTREDALEAKLDDLQV